MSDDYAAYLAHRFLRSTNVPVVILGEFPRGVAVGKVREGGAELVPPIQIRRNAKPNYESLSSDVKKWMIDFRFERRKPSAVEATLTAISMVLSEILFDSRTDEKRVHRFLRAYPVVVDAHGSALFSEVRLGDDYRIDLAVQYKLDEKRLLLIELESPNLPIFTKKGRVRAPVTHALQQVEDWIRWLREHPHQAPSQLDTSVPVEGLVVIGRNRNLTPDERSRLLHLNGTRKVKLITYDELLDRIEMLIQNVERAG
jgi:hypothetical protein